MKREVARQCRWDRVRPSLHTVLRHHSSTHTLRLPLGSRPFSLQDLSDTRVTDRHFLERRRLRVSDFPSASLLRCQHPPRCPPLREKHAYVESCTPFSSASVGKSTVEARYVVSYSSLIVLDCSALDSYLETIIIRDNSSLDP